MSEQPVFVNETPDSGIVVGMEIKIIRRSNTERKMDNGELKRCYRPHRAQVVPAIFLGSKMYPVYEGFYGGGGLCEGYEVMIDGASSPEIFLKGEIFFVPESFEMSLK